jgi:hypothetical protein
MRLTTKNILLIGIPVLLLLLTGGGVGIGFHVKNRRAAKKLEEEKAKRLEQEKARIEPVVSTEVKQTKGNTNDPAASHGREKNSEDNLNKPGSTGKVSDSDNRKSNTGEKIDEAKAPVQSKDTNIPESSPVPAASNSTPIGPIPPTSGDATVSPPVTTAATVPGKTPPASRSGASAVTPPVTTAATLQGQTRPASAVTTAATVPGQMRTSSTPVVSPVVTTAATIPAHSTPAVTPETVPGQMRTSSTPVVSPALTTVATVQGQTRPANSAPAVIPATVPPAPKSGFSAVSPSVTTAATVPASSAVSRSSISPLRRGPPTAPPTAPDSVLATSMAPIQVEGPVLLGKAVTPQQPPSDQSSVSTQSQQFPPLFGSVVTSPSNSQSISQLPSVASTFTYVSSLLPSFSRSSQANALTTNNVPSSSPSEKILVQTTPVQSNTAPVSPSIVSELNDAIVESSFISNEDSSENSLAMTSSESRRTSQNQPELSPATDLDRENPLFPSIPELSLMDHDIEQPNQSPASSNSFMTSSVSQLRQLYSRPSSPVNPLSTGSGSPTVKSKSSVLDKSATLLTSQKSQDFSLSEVYDDHDDVFHVVGSAARNNYPNSRYYRRPSIESTFSEDNYLIERLANERPNSDSRENMPGQYWIPLEKS